MTNMNLYVSPRFLKIAKDLPKDTKNKMLRILYELSTDVRHPALQTKKINGATGNVFECRVDQSVRLIYDVVGGSLRCLYVGAHDDAIKFGERFVDMSPGLTVEEIVLEGPEMEPASIQTTMTLEQCARYLLDE